jgi:hypothetical protein
MFAFNRMRNSHIHLDKISRTSARSIAQC